MLKPFISATSSFSCGTKIAVITADNSKKKKVNEMRKSLFYLTTVRKPQNWRQCKKRYYKRKCRNCRWGELKNGLQETERIFQSSVSLSGNGQNHRRTVATADRAVGEYRQQEEESGADEKRPEGDQGAQEGRVGGTSSRPLNTSVPSVPITETSRCCSSFRANSLRMRELKWRL